MAKMHSQNTIRNAHHAALTARAIKGTTTKNANSTQPTVSDIVSTFACEMIYDASIWAEHAAVATSAFDLRTFSFSARAGVVVVLVFIRDEHP
jgi:hypothetical protein